MAASGASSRLSRFLRGSTSRGSPCQGNATRSLNSCRKNAFDPSSLHCRSRFPTLLSPLHCVLPQSPKLSSGRSRLWRSFLSTRVELETSGHSCGTWSILCVTVEECTLIGITKSWHLFCQAGDLRGEIRTAFDLRRTAPESKPVSAFSAAVNGQTKRPGILFSSTGPQCMGGPHEHATKA